MSEEESNGEEEQDCTLRPTGGTGSCAGPRPRRQHPCAHASSPGSERSRRPVGGDCQPRRDEKQPPKTGGGQRAAPQGPPHGPQSVAWHGFPSPVALCCVVRGRKPRDRTAGWGRALRIPCFVPLPVSSSILLVCSRGCAGLAGSVSAVPHRAFPPGPGRWC